ncbi:MAG: carbohydrate kinase family protein [Anaerolineales bacterium]|nr:carbohydrate kinase family protein [Anaerolineales bacterium]
MKRSGEVPPLIGIGDLVADVVVSIPELPVNSGDFKLADSFYVEAGGTANFLILAARLNAPSMAMGTIGTDIWGREAAAILRAECVDLSLVFPSGSTTRALVLVDKTGDHAFVGKFGEGEDQTFGEAHEEALRRAGGLFVSGYSFSEEHLAELTIRALETAGEAKVLRSFDPGPAYAGLSLQMQLKALSLTDILILNEEELAVVGPEGVKSLFGLGITMVVLKLGADGCEIYCDDGRVIRHTGFSVPVVDTTAAGDSFAAGFLRALTAGLSLETCALFANAVGAAKVQKLGGGRNVPTYSEVKSVLASNGIRDPLS